MPLEVRGRGQAPDRRLRGGPGQPLNYLDFGSALVRVSLGLAGSTLVLAALGLARRDRRFVLAARRSQVAGAFTGAGAAAALVAAFFQGAYQVQYVFSYSERKLAAPFKLAGLWAGLDGSILFWAAILGLLAGGVAWGFRRDPAVEARRLEPWVHLVFAGVQAFFLAVIVLVANPFDPLEPGLRQDLGAAGLLLRGAPADGSGLNPLLENYWMLIHPPSLYLGFILYTVPFAFGLAALASGDLGGWWIRKTRRWTLVAWLLNTNGVVLGGLWAYEVLGWGGYWAWDPVENSSLLPWLTGTAFLHSVMIQERRDMLKVWNAALVCLTFFLSLFGTYLTRSGIVSSVHAFASGPVGDCFLGFLLLVLGVSLFLVFYRLPLLGAGDRIDSLLSREAIFLLNNLVLLAIAGAVVVLTLWPKISAELLRQSVSVQVPVYNLVCTPFFVLLLALTALGPGMAWIRTSPSRLRKNLLGPAAVALPLAGLTQWVAYGAIRGGDGEDPVGWAQHLYPGLAVNFLGWLIIGSLAWEVARTAAARGGGLDGLLRLVVLNSRRYGGYVVHVGLALLAIGVVNSSLYRVVEEVRVREAEPVRVGPYDLEVKGSEEGPVSAYHSTRVRVELRRAGQLVALLEPEKRLYPPTGYRVQEQTTTEVSIARRAGEDFYVYFDRPAEGGGFIFTVFRNPLINLVWLGWLTMIAGGIFAALPMGRSRVGLAG
ncbi:MAG: heme lyase CcmF/NrfE family subunit [Planctomycetes bacterium]|nr:heme lyase CcmF/NrfE family subunit [Planctomycetota bacterium]